MKRVLNLRRLSLNAMLTLSMTACAAATAPSPVPPAPTSPPPTDPPIVITIRPAPATPESNPDAEKINLGMIRYTVLECGACHGENARGTDKGPSLIGMTLSETDFMTLMRTGGNLASMHIYPPNRLSDADGTNLYLYLQSLDGVN